MTVPSEKTIVKGKCPNCGGTEWTEKYVDAISGPPREIPIDDYAQHRLNVSGPQHGFFAVMCGDFIQKIRQFILVCQTCGYTFVKDFYKEDEERKQKESGNK